MDARSGWRQLRKRIHDRQERRPLTRRALPAVEFYSGDLAQFVNERLPPAFPSVSFVGLQERHGGASLRCDDLVSSQGVTLPNSLLQLTCGEGTNHRR